MNAAMKSDKLVEWELVGKLEIDSLVANDKWGLVPRTSEMHSLQKKWVLKTKTDANGEVERYKACVVACGNKQKFGDSYTLTFAASWA